MSFTFDIEPGSDRGSGQYNYRIQGVVSALNSDVYEAHRGEMYDIMERILEHFVAHEGLGMHDKIQVRMVHLPTGHSRITPLVYLFEWDLDLFLDMIGGSIQSNDIIDPENTEFQFIYVKTDRVGAYFTAAADVEEYLRSKRCIVRIEDDDLCFFHCIALADAFWSDEAQFTLLRKSPKLRREAAEEWHAVSGLVMQAVTLEGLDVLAATLDFNVIVIEVETLTIIKNCNKKSEKRCVLLYIPGVPGEDHGHFHFVHPNKVGALWNKNNFCYTCSHAYLKPPHLCRGSCMGCGSTECEGKTHRLSTFPGVCMYCNLSVFSEECLQRHMTNYVCHKGQRCPICSVFVPGKNEIANHVCYHRKCFQCCSIVPCNEEHLCYIQKLSYEEGQEDNDGKFIFYDYETYVYNGFHKTALIVAMYGGVSNAIYTFKTNEEFSMWLFQKRHRGYTCIAHNGAKYDMHFIKREILRLKMKSTDICSGSSIFYIKTRQLRFIDSCKFIPMALRDFPKTFGLVELCKGYFPYRFLTHATLNYNGPFPDLSFFDFEHLKGKDYDDALAWYEENRHDVFDMESIIQDYCMSDVRLLKEGCTLYRRLFLEVTDNKVDPFEQVTIASTCLRIYRTLDMEDKSIARLIDHQGETEERNWIMHYISERYDVDELRDTVAVCRDTGVQLPVTYKLPSNSKSLYIAALIGDRHKKSSTALLYLDCFNSGCTFCVRRSEVHPRFMVQMRELYHSVETAIEQLKDQYDNVVIMRRCEWVRVKNRLKITEDVKSAPLRMRDAFFGGRTEPIKLYKQVEELKDERIGYVDFTSLYPSVQSGFYQDVITGAYNSVEYPVGHPIRITKPFKTDPRFYFGFMKVSITVPEDMYHAVLPVRVGGKLVFPVGELCGTWTTVELAEACARGCIINAVFDVVHFPKRTTDLFKSYVARFMKIKIEAGGWKKTGIDHTKLENVEKFVKTYKDLWGVKIDTTKITNDANPGLYYLAKLCLNSLWGKFAQRPDLGQTIDTFSEKEFNKICFSPKFKVTSIFFHPNSTRTVKYKNRQPDDTSVVNTNIAVAAFTTAHARLRLFSLIHHLGHRCLYYDTDSVIYTYNPLTELKCGPYLGDLTNEIDSGDFITTFVSTGPKSYGYRTAGGKTCVKVKGFTLNVANSRIIHFDSMRDLLFNKSSLKVKTLQFNIGEDHRIKSHDLERTLRFTSNKRSVVPGGNNEIDTVPIIIQ